MTLLNNMNYIFVDGSYFIFYRFHALKTWWANAKHGDPFPAHPHLNEDCMAMFEKQFIKCFEEIPKKLGVHKSMFQMIVGKDCLRENIWRTKLYPDYKLGRKECNEIGPFFEYVYGPNNLFFQAKCKHILEMEELEADDCIALTVKNFLSTKRENNNYYIITSDKDYLQLAGEHVSIFNLKFHELCLKDSSHNDAKKDLFCKIVSGDPSDNIASVFKKCGPKTALKYFENEELFKEKLAKEDGAEERYQLNKTLVDFDSIPSHLVSAWNQKLISIGI